MHRFLARWLVLIFASFFAAQAWAQTPTGKVHNASSRKKIPATPPALPPQQLFGAILLATHSEDARKSIELSLDKYENALMEDATAQAKQATEKDPESPLAYALLSFVSRRGIPNSEALNRAKFLLPKAARDEQILARWMTSVQDGDLLPAISSMNDLLKRYPRNKHVLYLTSEWLYFQQDYERSRKMMESLLQLDPDFPPVLNMLGYTYIGAATPDPAKAIASLKRYAEVLPGVANPEDSLGEILRFAGDDKGSLEHYSAALKIDPTFITSQVGLGDTSTLRGDYMRAGVEYDKAIGMATNSRDRLHAEYQKALVYFWEGLPEEGRKALAVVVDKAIQQKEPYGQFEAGLAQALLAVDLARRLGQLNALALSLKEPIQGMSEVDRSTTRAGVLREIARIAALSGQPETAEPVVAQLEQFAASSRDLVIENDYVSSRGFVLFAKSDFTNAADALASDSENPLVVSQLALAQDKVGDSASAQATRTHLKYLRAPTVTWFLATHPAASAAN